MLTKKEKRLIDLETRVKQLECQYATALDTIEKLTRELEVVKFIQLTGKDNTAIGLNFDGWTLHAVFTYLHDNIVKKVKMVIKYAYRNDIKIIKEDSNMAIITVGKLFYMLDKVQEVIVEIPCPGDCKESETATITNTEVTQ